MRAAFGWVQLALSSNCPRMRVLRPMPKSVRRLMAVSLSVWLKPLQNMRTAVWYGAEDSI